MAEQAPQSRVFTTAAAFTGWAHDDTAPVPPVVVFDRRTTTNTTTTTTAGDTADGVGEVEMLQRVHQATAETLAVLQSWLSDPRFSASVLMVVTCGAVAGPGEQPSDLPGAAVWGLVRSAQSEDPGRVILID
ncbi:SpnB-like Rossmann fold domain-containing protein, partial [Nocardia vulneris]|uniref:SpnB-like Rossmann fold domain-containing protein n=1 Tax=Nocardia vulneris TaxID=1141657 RepID=UPI001C3F9AC0